MTPLADIDKSLTDPHLIVEALIAAGTHARSHFVIVSNDKDFLPLLNALIASDMSLQSPRLALTTQQWHKWLTIGSI